MRTVLDTNVILSLWLFVDSRYTPIRLACEQKLLTPLTSPPCLEEFARVLRYPQFERNEAQIESAFAAYQAAVEVVTDVPPNALTLPRCKDRDDQKFLELARDGDAKLLVTKDKALLKLARKKILYNHFAIITPDRLLEMLEGSRGEGLGARA